MRKLYITAAFLAFFSVSAWANNILDEVTISGTFVATQPCTFNCTESVSIDFNFDPEQYPVGTSSYGYAVPGSLSILGSGFLGSFSSLTYQGQSGYINLGMGYMPFLDRGGDELDIRFPVNSSLFFPLGEDTIRMEFFSGAPESAAYRQAFGSNCCVQPTYYTSTVKPLEVPEYGSTGMLLVSAVVLGGAMWRRKAHLRADNSSLNISL